MPSPCSSTSAPRQDPNTLGSAIGINNRNEQATPLKPKKGFANLSARAHAYFTKSAKTKDYKLSDLLNKNKKTKAKAISKLIGDALVPKQDAQGNENKQSEVQELLSFKRCTDEKELTDPAQRVKIRAAIVLAMTKRATTKDAERLRTALVCASPKTLESCLKELRKINTFDNLSLSTSLGKLLWAGQALSQVLPQVNAVFGKLDAGIQGQTKQRFIHLLASVDLPENGLLTDEQATKLAQRAADEVQLALHLAPSSAPESAPELTEADFAATAPLLTAGIKPLSEQQADDVLDRIEEIDRSPLRDLGEDYESPVTATDADTLREAGLQPKYTCRCRGKKIHFSDCFELSSGRVAFVAYVEHNNKIYARAIYRSNSRIRYQCASHFGGFHGDSPRWLGKGYGPGKSSTVLPIKLQKALHAVQAAKQPLSFDEQDKFDYAYPRYDKISKADIDYAADCLDKPSDELTAREIEVALQSTSVDEFRVGQNLDRIEGTQGPQDSPEFRVVRHEGVLCKKRIFHAKQHATEADTIFYGLLAYRSGREFKQQVQKKFTGLRLIRRNHEGLRVLSDILEKSLPDFTQCTDHFPVQAYNGRDCTAYVFPGASRAPGSFGAVRKGDDRIRWSPEYMFIRDNDSGTVVLAGVQNKSAKLNSFAVPKNSADGDILETGFIEYGSMWHESFGEKAPKHGYGDVSPEFHQQLAVVSDARVAIERLLAREQSTVVQQPANSEPGLSADNASPQRSIQNIVEVDE